MKSIIIHRAYILLLFSYVFITCKESQKTVQFTLTDASETGLTFSNDLPYTEEFNTYTYRNFYNGGGIALGDINNDGLLDIYCTGNIGDNKLFLNKGNWKFEDITERAKVACKNVWSTGASMVDINGDGFLDIYVCKAGKPGGENRHNELFINNGDLTFSEKSKEYGLDIEGLSIHAAFFDYDKDGDLDAYVLNNSMRSIGAFDFKEGLRDIPSDEGNRLLRNDNGKFVDVSKQAGIYTSAIGYGLGITLSDFNQDGWMDIFISNDFFERDYLYYNNGDGTFIERGDKAFGSMSMGSMGADAADIDNDLRPDLFVTEMLPQDLDRRKTKNMYETWEKHETAIEKGYHYQFSRNVLQKNMGDGSFAEISRYAGVVATDWSWAALIQDFDNDGLKDIFVSNGQYKDLLDRDYLNFSSNSDMIRQGIAQKKNVIMQLIDSMPSKPIQNSMFQNIGSCKFKKVSEAWGLNQETFSNGSAYGDLDNDGDLDLVINNVNMPLSVYKNNAEKTLNKSIQFVLKGDKQNTNAIATKVILKSSKGQYFSEHVSAKGFQSSVADKLTIGVGAQNTIDSAIVIWPNDKVTILTNLVTNKLYTLSQKEAKDATYTLPKLNEIISLETPLDFKHQETKINHFAKERLLQEMVGFDGPALAVGDVNNDGIEDVFCGGGKGQVSELFISTQRGAFSKITQPFIEDMNAEKTKAVFFDSDGDGDLDLYVAHGGAAFSAFSAELNDVLYINDGKGVFIRKIDFTQFIAPISTGDVEISDLNKDGKLDIIIGEKNKVEDFGLPGSIYILYNQGNNYFKFTASKKLNEVGMIGSIATIDHNNDGWLDIVSAGKWCPISIYYSNKGSFENAKKIDIPKSKGLWNTIEVHDIDDDGDKDLICGNVGENNFYSSDSRMMINDFDENGTLDHLSCNQVGKNYYLVHDNDEIFSQLPIIKKNFLYHKNLSTAHIEQIFNIDAINNSLLLGIDETRSMIYKNEKGSSWSSHPMPTMMQYSSINTIFFNGKEMYCGGNFYRVKPQFGRLDASKGWKMNFIKNNNTNDYDVQSLGIEGEIRNINKWNNELLFAVNDQQLKSIKLKHK